MHSDPTHPSVSQKLVPLKELAHHPILENRRSGRPASYSCLWRWYTSGVQSVKLQVVRAGGQPLCCERWLLEFFYAVAAKRHGTAALPPRSPGARQRASKRAAKQLSKAGF
jgi:hypothetical protein